MNIPKKNRSRNKSSEKCVGKPVMIILAVLVGLCVIGFAGVAIAHMAVFSRADYDVYASDRFLLYSDLDAGQYPREEISILSGENRLAAWIYGQDNTQGLIVLSPGHRDANDIKLYEIMYFVDAGWRVLCYDYTGCYHSEGSSMIGYTQSVYDLDAVLTYVESDEELKELPVMLFGHSLGGYASGAVLAEGHDIQAAIIASPFDTPKEQWAWCIERFTGGFHVLLRPFTELYIAMKYGKEAELSVIDGINAVDIPVWVISGTDDEFYRNGSPVYEKRALIQNPNCIFELKEAPGPHGHYDYFLSEQALAYQNQVKEGIQQETIDKLLYMEHDLAFMDRLHAFLVEALP